MKPDQPSLCKRYACDRCREQKLRCSRSSSGDRSCERCLKSKSACVTSYSRPLGRPPLHSSIHSGSNQHRRHRHGGIGVRGSNADNKCTGPATSPNQAKETQHFENCPHYSWHQFTTANNHLLSPCSSSFVAHGPDASGATQAASFQGTATPGIMIPQAMPDVRLDSAQFINDEWVTGGFDDDIGAADFEFQLENNPHGMEDLQFDDIIAHASPMVEHVAPDESTADENDDVPPSRGSCTASSTTLMAVGNIFREITNLNHQPLDSANLCDTKLVHEAFFGIQPPPRSPHDGQEGHMPLGRVLDAAVRFVWALQTMNPVACGVGLVRPSPPTLSVTLLILSTYLELGQLLDKFLTHMNGHDDAAPTKRLAKCGQQASRHGTMLAQVVEHQLHSIERLIGLPEESRLWSRRDSYVGILDQDRPCELAHAVMGQAKGTFTSLKQTLDRMTTAPE